MTLSLFQLQLTLEVLAGQPAAPDPCSLNGVHNATAQTCACDAGWRGSACAVLDVLPATPPASYGLHNASTPTWGGGAVFEGGRWHLIVGSRAIDFANNTLADYPCDSRIVRAVSSGADPVGPYTIVEVLVERSSWEPALATHPVTGALVMMFFGNTTNPPIAGSAACAIGSSVYNLTNMNTYIAVSASGSVKGPWSLPVMVRGMENSVDVESKDPYAWNCASGNPSPAFHPNGTLYAAVRQNPCWKGFTTKEHIGIWRAPSEAEGGWRGVWSPVLDTPVYGWGGGTERNCRDANACPMHEDPHLWWDARGHARLLTHDQNNNECRKTRGAYGYSRDGTTWTLATVPAASNASAWDHNLRWTNGSTTILARRQRASLIHDPQTGAPTHLMNGADLNHHGGPPKSKGNGGFSGGGGGKSWCEGCHWGTGVTLIQPLGGGGGGGGGGSAGRIGEELSL